MASIFRWTAIVFGLVSAALWLAAAMVKTPAKLNVALTISDGDDGIGGDLADVAKGVAKQSKFNAFAASATGLAVASQALALLIQQCARP